MAGELKSISVIFQLDIATGNPISAREIYGGIEGTRRFGGAPPKGIDSPDFSQTVTEFCQARWNQIKTDEGIS